MRKIIKKWLCKIFHIKQCECKEEVDPHEELYLHTPEPEVPAYNRKLEKINRKHKKGSE
tara:strand:- start:639 stop:815 length:177 start_codon:yes stop_codon:yes gene_type:complete